MQEESRGSLFFSFSTKEIKEFILRATAEARSVALRQYTQENQKRDQQRKEQNRDHYIWLTKKEKQLQFSSRYFFR